MERKFTVSEIRKIFETIVVNSNRHRTSVYVTLDGEEHSTDVGYFEECMEYFLQDLETIAKEGNIIPVKQIFELFKDEVFHRIEIYSNNLDNAIIKTGDNKGRYKVGMLWWALINYKSEIYNRIEGLNAKYIIEDDILKIIVQED